jgi:hypothetical protein
VLLLIPPLAEASCGEIGTRIATATTKAILHKNLPDVKGAFMMIRSFYNKRAELGIHALIKINCARIQF